MLKIIGTIGLAVILLLTGCETTKPIVNLSPTTNTTELQDMVYPAVIQITYLPNTKIDKWLMYDFTPDFGHQIGEPLSISIYNSHDVTNTFSLTYQSGRGRTYSGDNQYYDVAPFDASNWITFPKSVDVPAKSMAKVPISLLIPSNINESQRWEIGIIVANTSNNSFLVTQSEVSIFMTKG